MRDIQAKIPFESWLLRMMYCGNGLYAAVAEYPVNKSASLDVLAILFVLYGDVASTALMSA